MKKAAEALKKKKEEEAKERAQKEKKMAEEKSGYENKRLKLLPPQKRPLKKSNQLVIKLQLRNLPMPITQRN